MGTGHLRIIAASVWLFGQFALASTAKRRDEVVQVVEKVSPAVVYVGTTQLVEHRLRGPAGDFWEDFFGLRREERQEVESLGSGVIIDAGGLVVTNDHVIRGAAAIHVILADGRRLDAEVIGADAENDLAVLKVHSKAPLPAVKLGKSSDLMIGETAVAIGSPFGLKKTVTRGVISATGRSFKADGRIYNDFLQTDASINPGNSGGPLLNLEGEIIGINTAIYASAQGIGFAIPADKVKRIVAELTQFGKVRPAWVGIEVDSLTPKAARRLGWDRTYGALVSGVDEGSPAERAGVQRGDIVADVEGVQVESAEDFEVRMRGYPARSQITVGLYRKGERREVSLSAVEFPPERVDWLAWTRLGIKLKANPDGLAITSVRPGSPAAQVGMGQGDVVLRVNRQAVRSTDELREALLEARRAQSVLLLVRRGRFGYHITLPF